MVTMVNIKDNSYYCFPFPANLLIQHIFHQNPKAFLQNNAD